MTSVERIAEPPSEGTAKVVVIDSARLEALAEAGQDYDRASRADRTWRGYQRDWHHFTAWCAEVGLAPLPASPTTVATYLTAAAVEFKVSTLRRRLAAVSVVHQGYGHDSPTAAAEVRTRMAGIARMKAGEPVTRKTAAWGRDVRAMVVDLPASPRGVQARALLTLGFAGGFRRSELVALNVDDLTETNDGLVVRIRSSKTDQEGKGRSIGIPYGGNAGSCPVRAVRAWLRLNDAETGPLFRTINGRYGRTISEQRLTDKAVARLVKDRAEALGLDPSMFAGHSLRAGFVTSAADGGASEAKIMAQTGHRSSDQVRTYMRDGRLFHNNAAEATGL